MSELNENDFKIIDKELSKYLGLQEEILRIIDRALENTINTHNNLSKIPAMWKKVLLVNCHSIAHMASGSFSSLKYYYDFQACAFALITGGYRNAFRPLYYIKLDYYKENLFRLKKEKYSNGNFYIATGETNKDTAKELENTITELFYNFHYVNDILFKADIYIGTLVSIFSKGVDANFEHANYIISQVEWLKKTRGDLLKPSLQKYEYLKLGLNIFEAFLYNNKKKVLEKFGQKFSELTKALVESSSPDVETYLLLSFIAEQTVYKELKDIVIKTYGKLYAKFPEYFDSVVKGIEDRKAGVEMKVEDVFKEEEAA